MNENDFSWLLIPESLVCAILVITLITVIYRTNKKYKRLRHDLFDFFNAPSEGMIFYDKEGKFLNANMQAQKYFPFLVAAHYTKGKPGDLDNFLNYLYENAIEADKFLLKTIEKVARQKKTEGFRELILTPDEKICMVDIFKTDSENTFILSRDITEIKEDDENFMRLNQFNFDLIQAIEASTAGVVVGNRYKDKDYILFVNKTMQDIVSLYKEEITEKGWNFLDTIFSKDNTIYSKLKNAIKNGHTFQCEIETQEGLWLDVRFSSVKKNLDQEELLIAVFSDITMLKKQEQRMIQSQKLEALGQLSAGVAHDFNNILSIIDGYSTLLMGKEKLDETLKTYAEKINNASKRGASLTSKMLTFSRHKVINEEVIELNASINEQIPLLEALLQNNTRLEIKTSDEPINIQFTTDHLSQILINLTVNARDAIENNGKITIKVSKKAAKDLSIPDIKTEDGQYFACVEVSDNGAGIDPEIKDCIFEPFFTTKSQGQGTGLGLSIIYGLLQDCGGFIHMDSIVSQGTQFFLYWPISNEETSKTVITDGSDIKDIRFDGHTILIVDDEPDILNLIVETLKKTGANILKANSGNDALVVQDDYEGDIDLLITDVVMPELNGVHLSKLFQSLRPKCKIIFMSGYPGKGKDDYKELPKDIPFLSKPLDIGDILRTTKEQLKSSS